MTAVKQKQKTTKKNSEVNTKINKTKATKKRTWEKVKIKGKVISDDAAGFEGLIGLEVMKAYDPKLVKSAKLTRKQRLEKEFAAQHQKRGTNKKQTKTVHVDENNDSDEACESSATQEKLTRKEKLAQRYQQKLEKLKIRREKRKAERKAKQNNENNTHSNEKPAEKEKEAETSSDDEYPPDRFALLRPPPVSDEEFEEDEQIPKLINVNALDVDDLEGWNGLGVPDTILRAIAENGFKSPTEIQALTLPAAIHGKKDILGAAETGSGKTLAFGIPILAGIMELKAKNQRSGIRKAPKLKGVKPVEEVEETEDRELTPPPEELEHFPQMLTDNEASDTANSSSESDDDDEDDDVEKQKQHNSPLYAVVLTPTRELAVQIRNHLIAVAKYTGIKIATVFGGLSVAKQERLLKKCPEIVVATPGRFWELYQQENRHLRKTDDISFLVIDETDRMVEKGHFEELRSLLKVLNANEEKKQRRQNFIFSATLTLVHDLPEHMQKRNKGKRPRFIKQTSDMKIESLIEELGISQPKIVDITRSQQTAQKLTECRLICPIDHKDYYLYYFLQRHPGRTILFCNSISCVKRLATLFGLLDCDALPLHANMMQKQRLKNLERFRDNPCGLLIATDVAARGLDIPNVEHVIHYQVPRTSENYVHRSGRTARANKDGITVMFMEPGETKNYVKLYKTLNRTEDLPLFPIIERYLPAVKERVNLAREVDKEDLKLKRTQTEIGWMKKQAEEMDMIIDGYNDESGSDQDEDAFIIEKRRNRVHLSSIRATLKNLLRQPIFPKGFSFKYPTSTGQLQMPDIAANTANNSTESNSAVKAMQAAIEDMKLSKKMRNKKRKMT